MVGRAIKAFMAKASSGSKPKSTRSPGKATLLTPIEGPELFIALVGAVGTDLKLVSDVIRDELAKAKYTSSVIRLSELLHEIDKYRDLPRNPAYERYDSHMTAGSELRKNFNRGDAMALLAVSSIREARQDTNRTRGTEINEAVERHAYILHSLKHPEEIETLRRLYGRTFCVVAAYAGREGRLEALSAQLCSSAHDSDRMKYRSRAEALIQRDEEELESEFGQDVRHAFPLGDLFVHCTTRSEIEAGVSRFVELLLGHPYHTPNRDELGMFYAQAAALRSADLSRQVGAAITTADGDLTAVGCNEVPKAFGGLYWPGQHDHRDFQLGYDTSTQSKREILAEILHKLQAAKWLSDDKSNTDIDALVDQALTGDVNPLMRGARLMNVLEFGRMVHAEMAALIDGARRGLSVSGATLYSTTFPCHSCARHIVAAGIRRVVYVEPYPKSMARDLYPDSIRVDLEPSHSNFVRFEAFVGIAPRRYLELFDMPKRKESDGKIVSWNKATSPIRIRRTNAAYILAENGVLNFLSEKMRENELAFV